MALDKLVLPDTFLEWCEKTNKIIDIVNEQISTNALDLLTTVSKISLVSAINELNDKKLDKVGGVITGPLQINDSLDVKNDIRVGSDLTSSSSIKFYDSNKLKYKELKLDANSGKLVIEDNDGNFNSILTSNTTIDLNEENIDIINKKTTSNIISTLTAKESQLYYSQDEKRLYVFDGVKKGGYKIPVADDIPVTGYVKVTSSDDNGYLNDKIETDIGIRKSISVQLDQQKIKLSSNTFISEMKLYAGVESSIPTGWMKCDGRLLDRTTYKDLFTKIGTIYGAGDGRTTFAIPNMSGCVPVGAGVGYSLGSSGGEATHTLTVTEIPEHKHIAPFSEAYGNDPWGLVSKGHYGSNGGQDFDNWWAYTSPVGGSQPHNNMQPYVSIFYIIFTGVY